MGDHCLLKYPELKGLQHACTDLGSSFRLPSVSQSKPENKEM